MVGYTNLLNTSCVVSNYFNQLSTVYYIRWNR